MKKTKIIVMIVILTIITTTFLSCILVNNVNAETIKITKSVTGTDGSVEFTITNLELDNTASYEWAIEKTKGATIQNWYSVLSPDYANGKINITVNSSDSKQLNVLKSTDNAYLTVRKVGESEKIIDEYMVDLSLPLSKAITVKGPVTEYNSSGAVNGFNLNSIVYGIAKGSVQYLWEEITDSDIINNYIDHEHDISGLNLKGKDDFPSSSNTTWKNAVNSLYSPDIVSPSKNGLYYLWLRGSDPNVKTVYGMTVVEIGEVKKVTSSANSTGSDNNKSDSNSTGSKNEEAVNLDPNNLIGFPMLVINGSGTLTVYDTNPGYKLYYQYQEIDDETDKSLDDEDMTLEKAYELIPKYNDSNWIKTDDKNFAIDSTTFTGEKSFILWVKLVSADGTISYDFDIYSVSGTKTEEENKSTNGENENKSNESANKEETSKAEVKLDPDNLIGFPIFVFNGERNIFYL